MSALDPFYLVKEEIQDSANNLQRQFAQWEQLPVGDSETAQLAKELLSGFESIEWQVDELDRAVAVAERDPGRFSLDASEIDRRRRWTASTRAQITSLRKAMQNVTQKKTGSGPSSVRRELLRVPAGAGQGVVADNESFIASENDRQALILKEQNAHLDEISASVERIGGVGLTIHEEFAGQERLLDEFGRDADSTMSRLDFVQKKLGVVMKKAGVKGQLTLIAFLIFLLLILIWLVFS